MFEELVCRVILSVYWRDVFGSRFVRFFHTLPMAGVYCPVFPRLMPAGKRGTLCRASTCPISTPRGDSCGQSGSSPATSLAGVTPRMVSTALRWVPLV